MSSTEKPIDIYHEKSRWVLDRTFELYSDRVRVFGTVRSTRSEFIVRLSELNPDANRLWTKLLHYQWAVMTLVCGLAMFALPFAVKPPMYVLTIPIAVANIPGLIYWVKSRREVEFARFTNRGQIVVLDVARVGPDVNRFDSFVAALQSQIARSQGS